MVPSDPISQLNSPPACNGTELCNQDCRALSLRLPAAFFRTRRINASRAHLPAFPGWNRHLEAAFHSPETTARFQATISRSKLPTCSFDTLSHVGPARSDSDSPTHSGSPRRARDRYQNPVARLSCYTPNPSSDLHSPSGPFEPLRIKAFNPIPGQEVHLPSAPDCLSLPGTNSILLVPIPDHRSRLAKRSVACCSSDLLEPQPSCTRGYVTVK
jgi:hypothetical protein